MLPIVTQLSLHCRAADSYVLLQRQQTQSAAGLEVHRVACLSHSDMIFPGVVHIVNLNNNGEDGMRTRRSLVHRRRASCTHLLPLLHEAVNAFLITDNCLRQILRILAAQTLFVNI